MDEPQFDYVIVGAGSAGCVLADRLSQCGRYSILVLESGGSDARFWVKVPIGYAINIHKSALTWGYRTAPDQGLNGRSISWPRGRLIGGSSSINAMAYVRGLAHDFDDWAASGAAGWDWQTVSQTYARMETRCDLTESGVEMHGDGPVWVSDLSDQMAPFSENFLRAAEECGHGVTRDMNGAGAEGIGYYRSTVRDGVRWSAADAFLRPAQARANLEIIQNAEVERLTYQGGQVTGVVYRRGGQRRTVGARNEVILSAGAINSPKLLQLSGFGPAELLRSLGIPVQRDLSQVGRGLQDHLAVSYQFLAETKTLNHILGRALGRLCAGLTYVTTRKGSLAVPVNQVGGFVRSAAGLNAPDLQLYFNPISYAATATGKTIVDRPSGYLMSAQPCRPTSTGAVEIASVVPKVPPRILANSLSTDEDKSKALAACKVLQNYARTDTLDAVTRTAKAPDPLALDDDALLEDFRNRASTVYHPTSTCRMGRTARDSVLDARLKVHGVPGLRVVDASAFPNITSGNTNAPTMMLAMRAADLILEDAV